MLLRVLALLAIAAAAARPVARWVGAGAACARGRRHRDRQLAQQLGRRERTAAARPVQGDGARPPRARATSADRLWLVTIDGHVRGGSAAALARRDRPPRADCRRGRPGGRARIARRASCAARDSTRGRSRCSPTASAPSGGGRPSIADAQLLLYAPGGVPPVNRAVTLAEPRPLRWTPRGARGGALAVARLHDVPHDAERPHVRPRHRGAKRGGRRARVAARARLGRRHRGARARRAGGRQHAQLRRVDRRRARRERRRRPRDRSSRARSTCFARRSA